jgi:hypothetical protein
MQIKSDVDIYNKSIKRNSKISGLIRAEEDTDGRIIFRSLFDGKVRKTLEEAVGHIELLGINDLRVFDAAGEATLGTRQGLTQVADKARLINEAVRNADPLKTQLLRKLGLGFVLEPGAEVGMTYAQFNHAGRTQNLKDLIGNELIKNAGAINITDEGATVINYNVGRNMLTSLQAKNLENVLGLGNLSSSFVDKVLGGSDKGFAKLPKRRQSFLSPRDISISGDALADLTDRSYVYDDVELFFKSIFNPKDVSKIDRYIMSAGTDMTEGQRRRLMNAIDDGGSGTELLNAFRQSLAEQLSEMSPGLSRGQVFNELKGIYDAEGGTVEGLKGYVGRIMENTGSTVDQKNFARSIELLIEDSGAIEKMRDGEFVANLNYLKEKRSILISEKNRLVNLPGLKDIDHYQRIKAVQDEIDKIESMAKTAIGTGKDKSSIARWFFGKGTFAGGMTSEGVMGKGESALIDFLNLPTEFENMAAVIPKSALKSELGISQSSILFNVAKSSSDIVYTDPLMIAYDPEYMNSPELKQAIRQNVEQKAQIMQDFQKTGYLPEEVKKAVFSDIEDELRYGLSEDAKIKNLGIKLSDLTPGARSSVLRNRQQAELITQLLMSGRDPRDIPELVSRINNYVATQAFRMKGDRIDLAMPDTSRTSLRTYQSRLAAGDGTRLHEKVGVNVSKELAQSPNARAMGISASGVADINFLQFRLQGKTMMMPGAAAQLYHHALGTFDLDDSGVDMMNTFKDAKGNDRMAFMIYRQPTGAQEKIFAQADLTHNQTLKTILETKHGNFRTLITDPQAISSLSTEERKILSVAEKVMNGDMKLDIRGLGYSSAQIDQVLIKLRIKDGKRHGFKPLVQMAERDIDRMAASGSAAALGTNNIMASLISGDVTHDSFMKSIGMSPGSAPMYSQGDFVNLIKQNAKVQENARVRDLFNSAMGTSHGSRSDISNFIDSLEQTYNRTLSTDDKVQELFARSNLASAVEMAAEQMQMEALPDVKNTLGLYINRQAASVSMANQIDSIVANQFATEMVDYILPDGSSTKIPLADYMKIRYSAAIIPPSEAVDAGVNLGQVSVVDREGIRLTAGRLDDIQFQQAQLSGALDSAIRQGIPVNQLAAENMLNDIYKQFSEFTDVGGVSRRSIELGVAGEHALSQKAKGLGLIRAMQIADQMAKNGIIDEGSLAGLDPSLVSDISEYGRVKKEDAAKVLDNYVEEMKHALTLVDGDPIKIAAIEQAIAELEHMKPEDALERIKLKEGTAAFKDYASTASMEQLAKEEYEKMESTKALTQRRSRLAAEITPSPKAQYMEPIQNLIESQRENLDEIDRIRGLGKEMGEANRSLMYYHQEKVSAGFFEGLSAIARDTSGSNVLDINDTLHSGLNAQYGKSFARSVLSSETAIYDEETAMRTIFGDSQLRAISKNTLITADETAVERLQQAFNYMRGGRTDISLAEVSKDDAKKYLKLYSGFEQSERYLQPGYDEGIYNFMNHRTGELEGLSGATDDAAEAFKFINAQENLSKIEDRYAPGVVDDLLMPADEIQDSTRRIVAADPSSINMGSRASDGAYTRVQDFMDSPALRQVYENPTIRRGAMGLAALAVFGFVYSARKDRTSDEISGPPLLPGGSAYESDMPKYIPSLSNLKYLNPVVAGMQYKINVNGSQKDIEKMQSLAEGVVDGPVNSTMYNSLPRLGNDPYQNVASRF